jgi:CD109 antigen
MAIRSRILITLGLVMLLMAGVPMPGCAEKAVGAEDYVVLVPRVLNSGEPEAVSVSLSNGGKLTSGKVELVLLDGRHEVFRTSATVKGKGQIEFDMPQLDRGEYILQVRGAGIDDQAKVMVEPGTMIFLQTDKPIYKPGQTIHVRAITLDSELKPVSAAVFIETQDAKGTKVFRKEATTDDYGMASLSIPLSPEPNLGVWKVKATMAERTAELDVRVEEYVLPKYDVKLELAKDWFLVDEPIAGRVSATYSFGKEVSGELVIEASRYVGKWESYQLLAMPIAGEAQFALNPVRYVSGVPQAKGMGNVRLDVTVREKSTGYEEETVELLSVAASSLSVQIIPEASVFKPGLPLSLLLVTETPDNKPRDASVVLQIAYLSDEFSEISTETRETQTVGGKALVTLSPSADAVALTIEARSGGAHAYKGLEAGYSPSDNFIHVEQLTQDTLKVGGEVRFKVNSTSEARVFYYDVVSRGKVVFSNYTASSEIAFQLTPQMAPSGKILVYQILPNSEVAADYLPFQVEANYPQQVEVQFSEEEAKPGGSLEIDVTTQGKAKVGLGVVDRSVYILAENRLNLQQVFDELERLYMEPQAELHEVSVYQQVGTRGAEETFADAGLVVLTNNKVPQGKEYRNKGWFDGEFADGGMMPREEAASAMPVPTPTPSPDQDVPQGLAKVERVRQFFPETWVWTEVITGSDGKAHLSVTAPDSITTWQLQAVALSQDKGLGMAEDELKVFQPFFFKIDLPYSVTRGEEFPVRVSIYNYLETAQTVYVEIAPQPWFDLLGNTIKTVEIAGSDITGTEFVIRPQGLGVQQVTVTARSAEVADAVRQTIIVEPEGVQREIVQNYVLSSGDTLDINTLVPLEAVEGSARAHLALTASYLTQTIEGLDQLLQMPFGCGEQNMILFAPNVYITKYLEQSGQLKAEVMAKAEMMMITGYQRELTYRRGDGSFSAFGDNDKEGSLWLTAFVLKTLSQAKDIVYIDKGVLSDAVSWILGHQRQDGSFEQVGFVHHREMMGGLSGETALAAYVAVALMEAGEGAGSARAVAYLEEALDDVDDAYTMAITAYALELAGSPLRDTAYTKLMAMAEEDKHGLHWPAPLGGDGPSPVPVAPRRGLAPEAMRGGESATIEATAYATLALAKGGDTLNAGKAAKWLVSRRNSLGGFGSTQDTVVALHALTQYARGLGRDVDLKVTVTTPGETKELKLERDNYDVLQTIEVPVDEEIQVSAQGKGEAVVQSVVRFNLPKPEEAEQVIQIRVDYSTDQVEVNDLVGVSVGLTFTPPLPMTAEMIVLDISVPTGFAPVKQALDRVLGDEPLVKRYEIAGRKVIFYLEGVKAGDSIEFDFQVRALYPVRSQPTASSAYSYYNQSLRGETISGGMVVE